MGNAASDIAAGDKNAHFSPKEIGGNILGGYAAGAAMGLLGSGMGAFNNYTSGEVQNSNAVNMHEKKDLDSLPVNGRKLPLMAVESDLVFSILPRKNNVNAESQSYN